MRGFDPFNDRTARDLRNNLSSALVDQLVGDAADAIDIQAGYWKEQHLAPVYLAYLNQQQASYTKVLAEIHAAGHTDPKYQAVVLWNAGLFFEMHELLESIWYKAMEPERTALKGLIQAAGAFVHNLRGKPDAARGLALRARQHLQAGAEALGYITNLDQLIQDLLRLPQKPTRLQLDPSL
jgi:hypothetical protein